MDLKDCLAFTFGLIGKLIQKGYQANVQAANQNKNGFYHKGKYYQRIFKAEVQNLPFVKFSLSCKL